MKSRKWLRVTGKGELNINLGIRVVNEVEGRQ